MHRRADFHKSYGIYLCWLISGAKVRYQRGDVNKNRIYFAGAGLNNIFNSI